MFLRHFQPPPSQLLLIHGLFGHSKNLRTFANILHQNTNYSIASCDLRNHGESIHGRFTQENIKNDLKSILHSDIVVCGHSLGGKILMHNIDNPYIKAGVVLDIGPKRSNLSLMSEYINLMMDANNIFESRKDLYEKLMSKIDNAEIVQFLMTNLVRSEENKWVFQLGLKFLSESINDMSLEATIPSNKPMLFIKGSESDYISKSDEAEIHKLYANAEIRTVKGSHWVHFQSPHEVANHIKTFMKENK
eukprot:NODE_733_length_4713_cov_0.157781.p2 type:complete len:248 gc:universal NODE_733_length_4713_cov_0.157781:2047-1304(-)